LILASNGLHVNRYAHVSRFAVDIASRRTALHHPHGFVHCTNRYALPKT